MEKKAAVENSRASSVHAWYIWAISPDLNVRVCDEVAGVATIGGV